MFTFKLYGPVASKKNGKDWIVRGGRKFLVPGEFHRNWYKEASLQLKVQRRPKEPIKKAAICITFTAGDRKLADLTNKTESIMDLLVDHQVLTDDNWFIVGDLHLKFAGVDQKNPWTIIEITEHED